jgi:hypothetical protein
MAHRSALMTCRTVADVLEQIFPLGAGMDKETMRQQGLRPGAMVRDCVAIKPEMMAPAITVCVPGLHRHD